MPIACAKGDWGGSNCKNSNRSANFYRQGKGKEIYTTSHISYFLKSRNNEKKKRIPQSTNQILELRVLEDNDLSGCFPHERNLHQLRNTLCLQSRGTRECVLSGISELLWTSDSYGVFMFTFSCGSIYCAYSIPVSPWSGRSPAFLAHKSLDLEELCLRDHFQLWCRL